MCVPFVTEIISILLVISIVYGLVTRYGPRTSCQRKRVNLSQQFGLPLFIIVTNVYVWRCIMYRVAIEKLKIH